MFIRTLTASIIIAASLLVTPLAAANDSGAEEGRVLVFWASWCGYCKESLRTLDSMQRDGQLQGYQPVAVNLPDDRKDPESYLKGMGIDLPSATIEQLRDAASGVIGVPWVVMLDAQGNVIAGQRAPRSREQISRWVGDMDRVYSQLSMLR